LAPHLRVVTLAGELFLPTGPVLAGRGEGSASFSRAREIREMEHKLKAAQETAARAEQALAGAEEAHRLAIEEQAQSEHTVEKIRQAEVERMRTAEEARQTLAAREEEARWQETRRAEIAAELQEAGVEEERLAEETAALREKIESAREAVRTDERERTEETLADSSRDVRHWQTRLALAEQADRELGTRRADTEDALARILRAQEERQSRVESLEQEQTLLEESLHALREEETRLSASIHETQEQIEPAEQQLAEVEAEQAKLEESETEFRTRLTTAERLYTQAQVDLARRQEELEGLRRRIEDDFGLVEFEYASEVTGPTPLPLEELVQRLPHVDSLSPEIEDLVNRRRGQMRRMSAVNPDAVREYTEVKERFEFLTAQVKDLQQAEAQLREVIAELDTMMQQAFSQTFKAVAEEFPRIFERLFGGGSARLMLTEGDHVSDAGIDIVARLPGRRSQGLALLSGGERSLTATALVFALLKVSPTPFCVLDEVDAMLDESNVGRFRDLLAELSRQTQFVIVTHNRNTVQAAQVIYGVSMGSDSASQVISLKLDEFANAASPAS
jgi:chromosome segregation protein